MKNVTLSIPEDLLERSRAYAATHGTSLNELIRTLLRKNVEGESQNPIEKLIENGKKYPIKTKDWEWNREEIYER